MMCLDLSILAILPIIHCFHLILLLLPHHIMSYLTSPRPTLSLSLQVLEVVGPPYSPEFINLFLPMVESDEVMTTSSALFENAGNTEASDPVAEFVGEYYHQNHIKQISHIHSIQISDSPIQFTARRLR